jgi:hypothetical protein
MAVWARLRPLQGKALTSVRTQLIRPGFSSSGGIDKLTEARRQLPNEKIKYLQAISILSEIIQYAVRLYYRIPLDLISG